MIPRRLFLLPIIFNDICGERMALLRVVTRNSCLILKTAERGRQEMHHNRDHDCVDQQISRGGRRF